MITFLFYFFFQPEPRNDVDDAALQQPLRRLRRLLRHHSRLVRDPQSAARADPQRGELSERGLRRQAGHDVHQARDRLGAVRQG